MKQKLYTQLIRLILYCLVQICMFIIGVMDRIKFSFTVVQVWVFLVASSSSFVSPFDSQILFRLYHLLLVNWTISLVLRLNIYLMVQFSWLKPSISLIYFTKLTWQRLMLSFLQWCPTVNSKHGADIFLDLTLYISIVGALQYATLTRP